MSLVERLIPDVVHLLGVVTGLIMTAIVLAILCSRRAAAVRHGIWHCALIATLLSPLAIVAAGRAGLRLATISVPWAARTSLPIVPEPTLPRPIPEPAEPQPVLSPAVQTASRSFTNLDEVTPPDPLTLDQETRSVGKLSEAAPAHSHEVSAMEIDPARPSARLQKTDWPIALGRAGMMTWGVGVLILLARFLRGLVLLRVLRRSARLVNESGFHQTLEQARSRLGVDRLPPIAVSPRLTSPVAVGVIRPLVILPEGLIESLSPASLGDVLVHESAHILRHDPLVGLLQRLAEMLYWPHPLVHLLNRRLARAREEICDNHVLKQGDPCEFARTLLVLAERGPTARRPLGSLPLLNARWKLEDRVAGLLDPRRKPMPRMSRRNLTCIVVLMLATGAALAGVRIEDSDRPRALEAEVESAAPAPPAELPVVDHPRRITGRVIDAEHGKPFKNATVRLFRDWKTAGPVTTGTDGTFAIDIRDPMLLDEDLIATTPDGVLQGIGTFHESLDSQSEPSGIEIRLEPCRSVNVLVSDAKGIPVPGATVEAITENPSFGSYRTDDKGRATIRFPAGRKVEQIIALKSGVGFDYFENYQTWPSEGKVEVPESVSLVLNGAQTGRIKAVDSNGKAVVGVGFYVWTIRTKGKLSYANVSGPSAVSRTDAAGVASFDWLPTEFEEPVAALLWPGVGVWHAPVRPMFPVGKLQGEMRVRLVRKAILRGKVLRPDGTPAAGILVEAGGVGKDMFDEYDRGTARTAADGTYAIAVAPDHSYMVGVWDTSWAARSLTNIVPRREGEVHDLTDLRLIKGTVVQGRLTRGPDKKPVEGEWVSLHEDGDPLPSDYKLESREWLTRGGRTDKDGRYSLRVGPGEYQLRHISDDPEPLNIGSEETITRDHLLTETDESSEHRIEGLVRERSGAGAKPVGNAVVRAVSPSPGEQQIVARTSAAGRFELSTRNDAMVFYARNHDGSRAGFAELKKGQREVIVDLDEASRVSGRVVDQDARPCENRLVQLRLQPGTKHKLSGKFYLQTRTDSQGRYRFPGLVIGSWCELSVYHPEETGSSLPGTVEQKSFLVQGPDPSSQPDMVLPISLQNERAAEKNAKPEPAAAVSRPPTVPIGPNRSEIADLVRAIGRDPVSPQLIDRIAGCFQPQYSWAHDFDRIRQRARDRSFANRLDALANRIDGKPLATLTLIRLACRDHVGRDDADLAVLLRRTLEEERQPGKTIQGTVTDELTGQPIPFPRVWSSTSLGTSDERGRFAVRVMPGRIPDSAPLWIEADAHASVQVPVDLADNKNAEARTVALRGDVPFFGTVVDRQGRPVEGAVVRASVPRELLVLLNMNPKEFRGGSHGIFEVRTDRQGRFSFLGIPASNEQPILLEVSHPLHQAASLAAKAPTMAGSSLVVTLEPGCEVGGQVVDGLGQPVPGAWVQGRDSQRRGFLQTAHTD